MIEVHAYIEVERDRTTRVPQLVDRALAGLAGADLAGRRILRVEVDDHAHPDMCLIPHFGHDYGCFPNYAGPASRECRPGRAEVLRYFGINLILDGEPVTRGDGSLLGRWRLPAGDLRAELITSGIMDRVLAGPLGKIPHKLERTADG